jgi:FkbM family methyltransferase
MLDRLLRWLGAEAPHTADAMNARYDAQTVEIIERVVRRDSNCVDVGCHKGAVLDHLLRMAPKGHHFAFEPLPGLFINLRGKYGKRNVELHEVALAEAAGETTFHHVVTNPGYSGILRRAYDRPDEHVVEIRVKLARLDDIVPADMPIRLVKIDVEGAELGVLKGGAATIARSRPFVVFEHGLGASEFYGTRPEQVHDFFSGVGLEVSLLEDWLAGRPPLARAAFAEQFDQRLNFYFLAHPEPAGVAK